MTQQPAVFSHTPFQTDRILRSTSGNANFQLREGIPTDTGSDWGREDSSEGETEPSLAALKRQGARRNYPQPYGVQSSLHAQQRASLRETRRAERRGYAGHSHTIRLGPTGLPDHLYEATYEHKITKEVITKVQRIPEAIRGAEHERYSQYRSRHRKDLGEDGKPVWTDETEEAFQHAVRVVPPVLGKKKVLLPTPGGGNRQLGRNELISIVIKRLTGQERTRKQISSHKQVLKNFVIQNQSSLEPHGEFQALNYYTTAEVVQFKQDHPLWEEKHSRRTWKWDDENCMLICTDFIPDGAAIATKSSYQLQSESMLGATHPPLPVPTLVSQVFLAQRMDFDMSLYAQDELNTLVHRFTTIQSESGAQAKALEDIEAWRKYFPQFESIMNDGSMQGSEIVLLDSSLLLMDRPKQSKCLLAINFNVDIQVDVEFSEFHVRNTFYEDQGTKRDTHSKKIPHDRNLSHDPKRTRLSDIPLKAEWWTQVFSRIMKCRKDKETVQDQEIAKAREEGGENGKAVAEAEANAKRVLAQEDSNSGRYLREMSLMQEISGYRRVQGSLESKRVAVFLWRFRRTGTGEIASTTWRRLNPPPSRTETNSPMPALNQPPLSLDTNILNQPNRSISSELTMEEPQSSHLDWERQWNDMQSDIFAKQFEQRSYQEAFGSYYIDQPQLQYSHTTLETPTLPSNDHLGSTYNLQSLVSQSSSQRIEPAPGHIHTPSESLGNRMKQFYSQQSEQYGRGETEPSSAQGYHLHYTSQPTTQSFNLEIPQGTKSNADLRQELSVQDFNEHVPVENYPGAPLMNQPYGHRYHQTHGSTPSQGSHSTNRSFHLDSIQQQQRHQQSAFDSRLHGQTQLEYSTTRQQGRLHTAIHDEHSPSEPSHGPALQGNRDLVQDEDIYAGGDLLVHFSRSGQEAGPEQPWHIAAQSEEQEPAAWVQPNLSNMTEFQRQRKSRDGEIWFLRPIMESANCNFDYFRRMYEDCKESSRRARPNDLAGQRGMRQFGSGGQLQYASQMMNEMSRASISLANLRNVIGSNEQLAVNIAFAMWRLDLHERTQVSSDGAILLAQAIDPSFEGNAESSYALFARYAATYFVPDYSSTGHEERFQSFAAQSHDQGVSLTDTYEGQSSRNDDYQAEHQRQQDAGLSNLEVERVVNEAVAYEPQQWDNAAPDMPPLPVGLFGELDTVSGVDSQLAGQVLGEIGEEQNTNSQGEEGEGRSGTDDAANVLNEGAIDDGATIEINLNEQQRLNESIG